MDVRKTANPENPPPDDAEKARHRARRKWLRVLFGFVLLATVIFVAANIGEGRKFIGLIQRADPVWLLVGLGYQVFTYAFSAAVWRVVLRHYGAKISLSSLLPLTISKLFIDKIIPAAGVSGGVLLVRGLESRGAPRPVATAALLMDVLSIYASRAVALTITIAVMWANGGFHIIVLGVILVFALVASTMLYGIFWVTDPERTNIPGWAKKIPGVRQVLAALVDAPHDALRNKWLLLKATILQLAVVVLDAATLDAMLRAIGHTTRADLVFAAFVMALVTSTISLIPGGLGAFEGISVLMLRLLRVPVEAGLASTLLLRAFTLWLPMLPGFFILRRESRRIVDPPGDRRKPEQ